MYGKPFVAENENLRVIPEKHTALRLAAALAFYRSVTSSIRLTKRSSRLIQKALCHIPNWRHELGSTPEARSAVQCVVP